VKPFKNGDTAKLTTFDAFCSDPGVDVIASGPPIFERATLIRAKHNFKLGDSLHLAAATVAGCHRFLTNDARLSSYTDVVVEILP
jgi:predicted nucleic acid-binding protein